MSPGAREEFDRTRAELERGIRRADTSYSAALAMTGRARRMMLDLGLRCLVETSPRLIALIQTMVDFGAQLATVAPAPPLAPRRLEYEPLKILAAVQVAVHHLLVSTRERFAFRLYFIRRGIYTLVAYLRTAKAREAKMQDKTHAAWADYHVLNEETIESFRLLLVSIVAVPAAGRVERPRAPA